eukprot:1083018_1
MHQGFVHLQKMNHVQEQQQQQATHTHSPLPWSRDMRHGEENTKENTQEMNETEQPQEEMQQAQQEERLYIQEQQATDSHTNVQEMNHVVMIVMFSFMIHVQDICRQPQEEVHGDHQKQRQQDIHIHQR